jgi:Ca-activated chloride channel family protein
MFRFQNPEFLLVIILPILFLLRYFFISGSGGIIFSSLSGVKTIRPSQAAKARHIVPVLTALGLVLLCLGLARPQAGVKNTEVLSEGIDIMLCLDTSGTMQAMDFELDGQRSNRLDVVKKVVTDFIHRRKNDRIGMIVFGDQAFTQCPLTLDYGILENFVGRLKVGMAGDMTALGSGLALSVKRLKDLPGKSRIAILLTDGRHNAGRITPETAAEIAKTYNIKVYTIGVGIEGESPFLMDTIFGKRYAYQRVDLDEDTLKQIAEKTGGRYYRATDTASLEKIYGEIDQLEKSEIKIKEYTEYTENFVGYVLLGLVLILGSTVLGNTRLRKIP